MSDIDKIMLVKEANERIEELENDNNSLKLQAGQLAENIAELEAQVEALREAAKAVVETRGSLMTVAILQAALEAGGDSTV